MFELSVARKYLTPRWRQLSVSIISLISILVIALVVWLIVVFFSVTHGLEKSWINKLIALTAPVRVVPTPAYYHSYYYQVDSISGSSNYGYKSIGEKLNASQTDPYDPETDEELPKTWAKPDFGPDHLIKDPVKLAFAAIDQFPGLKAKDFEMGNANLQLQLYRRTDLGEETVAELKQGIFVGTFPAANPNLTKTLLPLSVADWNNLLFNSSENHLRSFFEAVNVTQLRPIEQTWNLPKELYPSENVFQAISLSRNKRLMQILIPLKASDIKVLAQELARNGLEVKIETLQFRNGQPYFEQKPVAQMVPLTLTGKLEFPARLHPQSLENAKDPAQVMFHVEIEVQNHLLNGYTPLLGLQIGAAKIAPEASVKSPTWFYKNREGQFTLPNDADLGEGVLLPRSYREAGVRVGDQGYLSYVAPSSSSLQEQRSSVFVAGFYDPGIIPLGGKFVLANPSLVTSIRSISGQDESNNSNGINVYFGDLEQAPLVKKKLEKAFAEAGITPYWKIETYREFDFTKDLIQQLRSEKNLFSLLAALIIIVACSNIISMLIILVNDKKTEIGILRSMGATSGSIALIFGTCGIVMGVLGSAIGILAAIVTLNNLQSLIDVISRIQGYELFNSHFYGEALPNELSFGTLGSVIIATAAISLIAGLVPAIKASLLRPSAILRAE